MQWWQSNWWKAQWFSSNWFAGQGVTPTPTAYQTKPECPTATNTFSVQFAATGGPKHLAMLYQNRHELLLEYMRKIKEGKAAEMAAAVKAKREERNRRIAFMLLLD